MEPCLLSLLSGIHGSVSKDEMSIGMNNILAVKSKQNLHKFTGWQKDNEMFFNMHIERVLNFQIALRSPLQILIFIQTRKKSEILVAI